MEYTTIKNFFENDHVRLDSLLKTYQDLKRSDFGKAKEAFKDFKFGLQRHIVWEEEILFPLWEEKTGMTDGGPTHVMRMEHRQIGQYLEAIHAKVQKDNPESDEEEKQLWAVLKAHNLKEERILYPSSDKVVSEEDRAHVFRAMEDIPEERYRVCCGVHEWSREN